MVAVPSPLAQLSADPEFQLARVPAHYLENEIRYIISRFDFRRAIKLETLPCVEIIQSYFPDSHKSLVIAIAKEIGGWVEAADRVLFSQARLRSVTDVGGTKYFLQIKGKPEQQAHSERVELGVEISANLYNTLLPLASEGTVRKLRYVLEGCAVNRLGREIPCKAEIDLVIAAGKKHKAVNVSDFPYYLVEFEHPEQRVLDYIRGGAHSFEFLQHAVELTGLKREAMRPFSMRRIAKDGITDEAQRLAEKLLREHKAA